MNKELKWNIDKDSIVDKNYRVDEPDLNMAQTQMEMRTSRYEIYGLIAKNKNVHEFFSTKSSKMFSEGSSQYILRKSLANTIQRVPDGDLRTQHDKASIEHIQTEYIFNNKVLWSEFEGIDMLSNLTCAFKSAFIYGFAPVRTGFEKDYDSDARISFNIEQWSDVFINADCEDIRRPQIVWHRSYINKSKVRALLNAEGNVVDGTYSENTIKYVLDHDLFASKQMQSEKLHDRLKGSTALNSLELITKYERGTKEFVTYVPQLKAVFRRVPNYDPRLGIPWNFLVLEPDNDFPLGISQLEFLLADQQFQDLFQTSAYKNLLLAMEPPIMVSGWETNPSSYVFEPRKIWNLGNNPNQVSVKPVEISNTVLSGWSMTREAVAAGMLRQLNVADGTVSKDAGIAGFSGTPQGVEMQQLNKEVSINQYQKRIEYFFAAWANQALRMYINSMTGTHDLTVDETTRRKLFDIGEDKLIKVNKIKIDFSALSADLLDFQVRTGSLVEKKEDKEREALNATIQPIIQNLQGWSDENKAVIENEILLPALQRLLELSDTDLSNTFSESLGSRIAQLKLATMEAAMGQQQEQLDAQGQVIGEMAGQMSEDQAQAGQEEAMPAAQGEGQPVSENPMDPSGVGSETSPSDLPAPDGNMATPEGPSFMSSPPIDASRFRDLLDR